MGGPSLSRADEAGAAAASPALPLCACRVFSHHLLKLCKLHPSLVVDQSRELLEFAGTTANVYGREEVYTHVVPSPASCCFTFICTAVENREFANAIF